jgi:hypothetical protein
VNQSATAADEEQEARMLEVIVYLFSTSPFYLMRVL